jgi:hypothetical protein
LLRETDASALVGFRDDAGKGAHHIDEVKHVLNRECVVHRTALELTAVREDLLRNLRAQNAQSGFAPGIGFRTLKVESGEDQRLGVDKQVVPEQMPLKTSCKPARLDREARNHFLTRRVTCADPLDPVHDAQRCRIRLPS